MKSFSHLFPSACFLGWQDPFMAQPEHPQPHEDLPFFLLRTMCTMTAATAAASMAPIKIVPMFSEIHVNIFLPPVVFPVNAMLQTRFAQVWWPPYMA